MEGKTYKIVAHESAFTAVTRPYMGLEQLRLSIPEADISIWKWRDKMVAILGSKIPEKATDIREVQVPDELVSAALELIRSQTSLNEMSDLFTETTAE